MIDEPTVASKPLVSRADIALLTLRLRALRHDAEQAEAAASADPEIARQQLLVRLEPMVDERRRALDQQFVTARAEAAAMVDDAHRSADAILADAHARVTASQAPTDSAPEPLIVLDTTADTDVPDGAEPPATATEELLSDATPEQAAVTGQIPVFEVVDTAEVTDTAEVVDTAEVTDIAEVTEDSGAAVRPPAVAPAAAVVATLASVAPPDRAVDAEGQAAMAGDDAALVADEAAEPPALVIVAADERDRVETSPWSRDGRAEALDDVPATALPGPTGPSTVYALPVPAAPVPPPMLPAAQVPAAASLDAEALAQVFGTVLAAALRDSGPRQPAPPPKTSFLSSARHLDVILMGITMVIALVILAAWLV